MTILLLPTDGCPHCMTEPVHPYQVMDVPESAGLAAWYKCAACGQGWLTGWDASAADLPCPGCTACHPPTETREHMPVKGHYEMRDGSADWAVITKDEYVKAEVAAGCWDDSRPGEPVHWSFTSGHQAFRFVPDPTPADDDELKEQTR